MFFVLSKTLNYLTMPLTIICACLLASALIKHVAWKRRLFWTGLGMLLLLSNEFIANECMSGWEGKPTPFSAVKRHKLGIVLTGTTISMPIADRVYFARGADRVYHTVQLYKLGLVEKILISGGTGALFEEEEPEAEKFRKAMIVMGVPDSVLIIEKETRNTYESAVQVKKVLAQSGYRGNECFLVTSGFHMRRSLACYKKAGIEPEPFRTDFYSHPRDFYFNTLLIPKIEALFIWQKLFKEWIGYIAYTLAGYI